MCLLVKSWECKDSLSIKMIDTMLLPMGIASCLFFSSVQEFPANSAVFKQKIKISAQPSYKTTKTSLINFNISIAQSSAVA